MPQAITIPKNPVYPPSMDWDFLREEGMRYIERFGSAMWTDYNLHDPGITILEVLCYALTDLGYRVNLPDQDLFADPLNETWFTGRQVLPNGPVTALDYRKLLIDIPGVRNAWLAACQEPSIRYYYGAKSAVEKEQLNANLKDTLVTPYQSVLPAMTQDIIFDFQSFTLPDTVEELLKQLDSCPSVEEEATLRRTIETELLELIWNGLNLPDNNVDELIRWVSIALPYLIQTDYLSFREQLEGFFQAGNIDLDYELFAKLDACYNRLCEWLLRQPEGSCVTETYAATWETNLNTAVSGCLLAAAEKVVEVDSAITPDDLPLVKWIVGHTIGPIILAACIKKEAYKPGDPPEQYYNLFQPQGIYRVYLELEADAAINADAIKATALARLHANRNLTEDFSPEIQIVEKKRMGLELDLEIDPALDEIATVAQVLATVQDFLSPNVAFYSLEQLLNRHGRFTLDEAAFTKLSEVNVPVPIQDALRVIQEVEIVGIAAWETQIRSLLSESDYTEFADTIFVSAAKQYDSDPVYRGPLLTHGFIDEEELAAAQPRQTIYKSDLYQHLLNQPGVRRVKRLRLFHCEGDQQDDGADPWCLSFDCKCLPELHLDCSVICVSDAHRHLQLDLDELRLELLSIPPDNNKIDRRQQVDLPNPPGFPYEDLTDYTSVQEDLPRTYKLGINRPISTAPPERKAKSKQLAAFLLFFDQLLLNYLASLDQVLALLDVNQSEPKTPVGLPYEVPDIRNLLKAFNGSTDAEWEAFINGSNNPFLQELNVITAGSSVEQRVFQRKVLDHLLGRFGEAFTDYTLRLYQIDRRLTETEADDPTADPIVGRQQLLKRLPDLAGHRARGFNYQDTNFWDTQEVAGFKARIMAHLGIEDVSRHTITCRPNFEVKVEAVRIAGSGGQRKYEFFIRESEEKPERLLVSVAKYSSKSGAQKAAKDFQNQSADWERYGLDLEKTSVGFWPASVLPDMRDKENAMLLEPSQAEESAQLRLDRLKRLVEDACRDDSFHVIEHILLRPRNAAFADMLRPIPAPLGQPELADPYSFRITILVPGWLDRYQQADTFTAFEALVYRACPAHILPRIARLDRPKMLDFEQLYFAWLKALTNQTDNLPIATDQLVQFLNQTELYDASTGSETP